ncbi:GTPase-associated protein 1-related protein [Amycolatopsis rifamycinica]|uniref:Uncharacterized protein n=1 Tax=Amycolatopsis rifamycinica TaxID=287986 RepID=A0A066U8C9_9PSEU|nr:GTPase-associated protein 1-related protein [Amycolatopsis rifamycinica]KDN22112.1 hypothetical protein DV20_12070 [Amycolatopsis rifamycinica]
MSGPPEFGSLYYTDCVPGQGTRGGAGFQFQAVSPGIAHDTMSLVQRTCLYEPPVAWMREQRDVAEYPPSLTHVFDEGVYVTARGRYLGAEANGAREGNQFTHAVVTTDPEAYGLTRPAQLWDAPWWAESPAPTTECDPLPADPAPGPWGLDAVREWVLGRPGGEEWLLAVHSALDRLHTPEGRRVLFVSDDASAVLGWLAAGTVLLAQARALRVGFRVFAANPRQSRHDVLAVHDDWAGPLANPERDHGFLVFNLTTGRHSAVEPTEGARLWVPRFLRQDPYDVVDAIELAQRFAGDRDRPDAVDRRVAALAVLGEPVEHPVHAAELVGWLGGRAATQPEEVVQPIAEAALRAGLDLRALRGLHEAVRRHGIGPELARVERAVFAAELAALTGAPISARPDATKAELAARAADAVAPERLDDVLLLATRFDAAPRIAEFPAGAHRFARWWADHPDAPVRPERWSCGGDVVDLVRDELTARLAGPDAGKCRAAIGEHWWRRLLPAATDPTADLDAAVTAAAVASGGRDVRRETITEVLVRTSALPAEHRGEWAWHALFTESAPTAEELTALLRTLPAGPMPGPLEDVVAAVLDQLVGERPTAAELDVLAEVSGRSALPGRSRLAGLSQEDAGVRRWLAALGEGKPVRPNALAQVSRPVLTARAADIAAALLDRVRPAEATAVVERAGPDLLEVLLRELPRHWDDREQARRADVAAALSFVVIGLPATPDAAAGTAERVLLNWLNAAGRDRQPRIAQVLRAAGEDHATRWHRLLDSRGARGTTGQTERAKRTARDGAARAGQRAEKRAADGDGGTAKSGWRLPGFPKGR